MVDFEIQKQIIFCKNGLFTNIKYHKYCKDMIVFEIQTTKHKFRIVDSLMFDFRRKQN